jgi:hypothetical protein
MQSIVVSIINAEALAGKLQMAHIGLKGVEYTFVIFNVPSTCLYNIVVNNKTT